MSWLYFSFQLQVRLQQNVPQPDLNGTNESEDDVDAALTELQVSLEGSSISTHGDITHIPELHDYLRFFKWVTVCNYSVDLNENVLSNLTVNQMVEWG